MKITIFGATGALGSECLRQSLEAGHKMTVPVYSAYSEYHSQAEYPAANLVWRRQYFCRGRPNHFWCQDCEKNRPDFYATTALR